MKFRFILIILVLLTSTVLQAYADKASGSLELRIVSLAPSQTEMLFHLGLGDRIVGVSDYCNFPKDALFKQKVGGLELNIERIMSLKPDVLVDINHLHQKYQPMFEQLGMNYVNFNINEIEELPVMATQLCELLNVPQIAPEFHEEWQAGIASLSLSLLMPSPKVYMEIWDTPTQGAGGASFLGKLVEMAGGKNVLGRDQDFPVVNNEQIISSNPDIIILAYPSPSIESVKNRPGWKSISAVKANNIFSVDQDLFVRPGPRNLEGLALLNKIFNKAKTP